MASYKASPYYMVGVIRFDMNGNYSTDVAAEIATLDALVPTWIKRVDTVKSSARIEDEPKKTEEPAEDAKEPESEPEKPARSTRKTSAK